MDILIYFKTTKKSTQTPKQERFGFKYKSMSHQEAYKKDQAVSAAQSFNEKTKGDKFSARYLSHKKGSSEYDKGHK